MIQDNKVGSHLRRTLTQSLLKGKINMKHAKAFFDANGASAEEWKGYSDAWELAKGSALPYQRGGLYCIHYHLFFISLRVQPFFLFHLKINFDMSTTSETKVITGEVRFSYAHVFTARAMKEGETPKYSTAILIPKDDEETLAKIDAAVEAAKKQGKGKKRGGEVPPKAKLKLPLRDGDEEYPDNEEYAGMYFLNASNTRKPQIVDASNKRHTDDDPEFFYSGCLGRASINFYAFAGKNKGIAVSLQNLQKLRDDEPLGVSIASAEDDFGGATDFEGDEDFV